MNTRGSDGADDRRQENPQDTPVQIPQFREVAELAGSELAAVLAGLGDVATLDDVRHAVGSFARAARKGGVAPEHMLVMLKRLLHQAKTKRGVVLHGIGPLERGVVEAAIADYFAAPTT
jgi:hypothetical protein